MLFNRNHDIIMVNVRLSPLIGKHIILETEEAGIKSELFM